MKIIMNDLKGEIARRGLKIKTVADASGVDYNRLVRIINGFVSLDSVVIGKVRACLEHHDQARAALFKRA